MVVVLTNNQTFLAWLDVVLTNNLTFIAYIYFIWYLSYCHHQQQQNRQYPPYTLHSYLRKSNCAGHIVQFYCPCVTGHYTMKKINFKRVWIYYEKTWTTKPVLVWHHPGVDTRLSVSAKYRLLWVSIICPITNTTLVLRRKRRTGSRPQVWQY